MLHLSCVRARIPFLAARGPHAHPTPAACTLVNLECTPGAGPPCPLVTVGTTLATQLPAHTQPCRPEPVHVAYAADARAPANRIAKRDYFEVTTTRTYA